GRASSSRRRALSRRGCVEGAEAVLVGLADRRRSFADRPGDAFGRVEANVAGIRHGVTGRPYRPSYLPPSMPPGVGSEIRVVGSRAPRTMRLWDGGISPRRRDGSGRPRPTSGSRSSEWVVMPRGHRGPRSLLPATV